MIKHVDDISISLIFNNERQYLIPKYQREYTWGKKEWGQLFEDITENDTGYFLGSIICVNDVSLDPNVYELIDGQQRLTTSSILLLSIFSKLKKLKSEFSDDDDLEHDYNSIRRELFKFVKDNQGNKTKVARLQLQVQNSNKDDYESILREHDIDVSIGDKPKYAESRRIYKAFNFFNTCIDEYVEQDDCKKKSDSLFKLANKLNSAVLVNIEVDTHKDAYMLFESLNNRGIPLSAIDLMKNILIRESESDHKTDETYKKWEMVIKNLGDSYSTQERFFRQYYNAFRDEINEPYKDKSNKLYELGYLATRTTILDIYERLIKDKGYDAFMEDMLHYSKLYAVITNNSEDKRMYQDSLLDLERIQGAPSYLLLLYILDKQFKEFYLTDEAIKEITRYLINFFVRRNITDVPNTRDLNKIFMEIVSEIKGLTSLAVMSKIKEILIKYSASDELFETKLRGSIYLENDMATRFILCKIESLNQTKEIYTDFWKRDNNNKFIWTIEHIFPEGQNVPMDWVNMIADGDKGLAQDYLQRYAHTIGNLTLTGYNQNLSNMSFERKRDRMKDGKYVGYRNGLKLNEDVVDKDMWTVEEIERRTDKLVKICLNIFDLKK